MTAPGHLPYSPCVPLPYVLIIEDSVADAELVRAALQALSFNVEAHLAHKALTGLECLSALQQRKDKPESVLIWLDLSLPEMDGLELLRQVRSDPATRCIPVIAFSGSEMPERVQSALQAGANAYVHKPDDVDIYMMRVAKLTEAFLIHTLSKWRNRVVHDA